MLRPVKGIIVGASTRVRRRVLDTAPINPAAAAIFTGLLNITEKPNTPTKLITTRRSVRASGERPSGAKSSGAVPTHSATIQPTSVAITIIDTAYERRSIPLRMSSLAMSRPAVMSGKPGITKSMAPI